MIVSQTGLVLLLTLYIGCTNADVRSLTTSDSVVGNRFSSESKISVATVKNEKLCQLCEEYAGEAIHYLSENKTQYEIIHTLHQVCSGLLSFKKKQCISLVDYYAPLFFMEIATISSEQLCGKVNLCGQMGFARLQKHDEACTLCHLVLVEILTKLKDPDRQLEILEVILKGCDKIENFVPECKKLILQYGSLFLVNIETFLETTDVCTSIHACKASNEFVVEPEDLAAF
ncbi:uncharacterized protein [Typha angustifolia]|uniref:uncharacterized protein isoform X1 n=1 Tax=Typha angustifolia TaxID=59011 RepID=UPI003C2F7D0E